MNCVSPRQERSSPLALTECIGLLSGALVHLPAANGKAAAGSEGSTGLCVGEREKNGSTLDINSLFLITQLGREWLGVIAGMGEVRSEYYCLSRLCRCDRRARRPSFTTVGSHVRPRCPEFLKDNVRCSHCL